MMSAAAPATRGHGAQHGGGALHDLDLTSSPPPDFVVAGPSLQQHGGQRTEEGKDVIIEKVKETQAYRDVTAVLSEALESRLASAEVGYRDQVASLRHALEEGVRALGTCSRTIDARGEEAMQSEDAAVEWQNASLVAHGAAELGRKVLRSTGGAGPRSAFGATTPALPARTVTRASSCSGLHNRGRGASCSAIAGGPSVGPPPPVSVEVEVTGSCVAGQRVGFGGCQNCINTGVDKFGNPCFCPYGQQAALGGCGGGAGVGASSSQRRARSGSPGSCGHVGAGARRYLVATPLNKSPSSRMIMVNDSGANAALNTSLNSSLNNSIGCGMNGMSMPSARSVTPTRRHSGGGGSVALFPGAGATPLRPPPRRRCGAGGGAGS